MKNISIMAATFIAAAFVMGMGPVPRQIPQDLKDTVKKGVVQASRLGNTNHCHLKFPPIDRMTLGTGNEKLINPDYGVLIDFYGPCDYDPLGDVAIAAQMDVQRRADMRARQ